MSVPTCWHGSHDNNSRQTPSTSQARQDGPPISYYRLGRALALHGQMSVNGVGSSGCMDAMNVGANDASGRIVGLIHEMFVREGRNWFESGVPTKQGRWAGACMRS